MRERESEDTWNILQCKDHNCKMKIEVLLDMLGLNYVPPRFSVKINLVNVGKFQLTQPLVIIC